MKRIKYSVLIFTALISAGCATILNPYNEDFSCAQTDADSGKCVPLKEAYDESVNAAKEGHSATDKTPATTQTGQDSKEKGKTDAVQSASASDVYRNLLYKELSGLIENPVTPMVAPPKVLRALLLPYEGSDDALYMYRYIYFIVQKPQWILNEDASIPPAGDN